MMLAWHAIPGEGDGFLCQLPIEISVLVHGLADLGVKLAEGEFGTWLRVTRGHLDGDAEGKILACGFVRVDSSLSADGRFPEFWRPR